MPFSETDELIYEAPKSTFSEADPIVDIPKPEPVEPPTAKPEEQKPAGFFHAAKQRLKRWDVVESVPFLAGGVDFGEAYVVYRSAKNLQRAEKEKNDPNPVDIAVLQIAHEEQQRRSQLKGAAKIGDSVASILVQLPAFAGELVATSGLYTLGRAAAQKAATKALAKFIDNAAEKAATKYAARIAGGIAGSAVQFPAAGSQRVAAEAVERMTPGFSVAADESGKLRTIINEAGDDFGPAVAKALGSQYVEVLSEHSGGMAGEVLGKVPGVKALSKLKEKVVAKWFQTHPNATVDELLKQLRERGAWHGVVNEMIEERLAEVGRIPIEGEYRPPDKEQLAAEAIGFSVPGAGAYAIRKLTGRKEPPDAIPEREPAPLPVGETPGTLQAGWRQGILAERRDEIAEEQADKEAQDITDEIMRAGQAQGGQNASGIPSTAQVGLRGQGQGVGGATSLRQQGQAPETEVTPPPNAPAPLNPGGAVEDLPPDLKAQEAENAAKQRKIADDFKAETERKKAAESPVVAKSAQAELQDAIDYLRGIITDKQDLADAIEQVRADIISRRPPPDSGGGGNAPTVSTRPIPTGDFITAEPLQPRADKFSETTASKVESEGFSPQESAKSPPLIWRDTKTGKLYRAGGSSRAEGLRRLGDKAPGTVDVLFSDATTKEAAFEEAIANNMVSTPENIVDTASAVRKSREQGTPDERIAELRRISGGDVGALAAFDSLPAEVKSDFKPQGKRDGARPPQSEDSALALGRSLARKILTAEKIVADYLALRKQQGRVNPTDLDRILDLHEKYQAKLNAEKSQGGLDLGATSEQADMFGKSAADSKADMGWQKFRDQQFALLRKHRTALNQLSAQKKAVEGLKKSGKKVTSSQEQAVADNAASASEIQSEMKAAEQELLGTAPAKTASVNAPKETPGQPTKPIVGESVPVPVVAVVKEDTRTAMEVLNQEKRVKVKVPAGATMLRVTTPDGKVSVQPLTNVTKGDNVFRGSGGTKLEAGTIDRRGNFLPTKGEVKVSRVEPANPFKTDESEKNSERAKKLGAKEQVVETEQEALDAMNRNREANGQEPAKSANLETGVAAYYDNGVIYYILEGIKSPEQFLAVQREEIAHHINSSKEAKKVLAELGRAPEFELERREIRGSYPKVESETQDQYSERIANEMLAKSRVQDAGLFQRMMDWFIEKLSNLRRIGDWIKESDANRQAILRAISRRLEKNFTAAGKAEVPLAALAEEPEAETPEPPIESAEQVERNEQRRVHQVMGRFMGAEYQTQPYSRSREFILRNYFGISGEITPATRSETLLPVTAENTERATTLVRRMSDPAEKGQIVKELREVVASAGGEMDAATQALQNELMDYATRSGDMGLRWDLVRNWGEMLSDLSAAGRELQAVQQSESYKLYKEAYEFLRRAKDKAAELVGRPLFDALNAVLGRVPMSAEVGQEITTQVGGKKLKSGKTIDETLGEAPDESQITDLSEEEAEEISPAERTALAILKPFEESQTEWVKPEGKKDIIREIVKAALKGHSISEIAAAVRRFGAKISEAKLTPKEPFANVPALFVNPLSELLQEQGVTPETAARLAFEVHKARIDRWSVARERAMKRAANRGTLSALIEEIRATPYLLQRSPAWLKETSENWFMSRGLSREQAQEAASLFSGQFTEALRKATAREAEMVLKDKRPGQGTIDLILRSIRSGLFDPSKEWYSDALAERGFKNITEADFKLLADLDAKMSNPELSQPERSEIHDNIFAIWRRLGSPPDVLSRLASNMVASLLTGFRTDAVNVFAPQVLGWVETALTSITSPRDFPAMLKAALGGYKTWLAQIKFSMSRDAYSFLNNDFIASQNILKAQWERGLRQVKGGSAWERTRGAANMLYGFQQYFMRFLNAVDNANGVWKRDTMLALYTSQGMRHLGFSNREINAVTEMIHAMREQYYAQAIDQGMSENQAVIRANALAYDDFINYVNNAASTKGDPNLGSKLRIASMMDAYSSLGRRGEGIENEKQEGGVVSRALMNPLIEMGNAMAAKSGLSPALRVALFGYMNVPWRTFRYYAWNTPLGLLRLGHDAYRRSKGKESWWQQSLATELQQRQRLKLAVASTITMSALTAAGYALAQATSASDGAGDDDDDGVYFTGSGPTNKQLRSAWMAAGFRPNSIVFFVGGKPIYIDLTRSGEPLGHMAWMLSARDDAAWREKEALAKGATHNPSLSDEVANAAGTYLGLMSQRGLFSTIAQIGQVASGREDPRMFLAQKGGGFVAGLVTPYLGLQQSVAGMLSGAVDRSSIESAIYANAPIFGLFGDRLRKPQLNRFGDPLYNPERSWYHKMYYTGAPVGFGLPDTSENRYMYGALMEKGVAPPALSRSRLETRFGRPLSDEEFYQFASKSGQKIKAEAKASLSTIKGMEPEAAKRLLSDITTRADRATELEMGLQWVKPLQASGGGGGYSPFGLRNVAPAVSSARGGASLSRFASFGGGSGGSRGFGTSRRRRTSLRSFATRGRTRTRLRRTRLRIPRLRTRAISRRQAPRLQRPRLTLA